MEMGKALACQQRQKIRYKTPACWKCLRNVSLQTKHVLVIEVMLKIFIIFQ